MRVFLYEIKKMFNPLRMLAVLVFAVIIFSLYVAGEMNDIFPDVNNRMNCTLTVLKKFGTTLSADERIVFEKEIIKPYRDTITEIIAADEYFQTAGVKDYNGLLERAEYADILAMGESLEDFGYEAYDPKKDYSLTDAEKSLIEQYRTTYRYANIQHLINAIEIGESYQFSFDEVHKSTDVGYFEKQWSSIELFNKRERELCNDLYADGEIDGVMSGVCNHVQNALTGGMFLLILSLFALMVPVVTADNMTGTNLLQAASKTGRRVYKKQFLAMLIVSLAFTTLELAAFAGVFFYSTAKEFLSCTLNTFYGFPHLSIYFFRGTLGAYVLSAVGLT